ncbi:MAG: hypothetical protein RMK91_04715 [Pseudanabaenaceae cyanobacterium SKYGB_i_bin29]|nr:hypothetical protein [Pseudanabaenaceae cyanobacterium SKYG29]MDW8421147.1 hypothetical protein [Pseudanabaenaceae cyanobacterium SKYGB_i_bin29]
MNYYFPSDPPYLLFVVALLAALACGRAFEVSLRQRVDAWSAGKTTLEIDGLPIQVPYGGMAVSIGMFLAAGLEIFGFPPGLAYPVAIALTVGSGWFVWRQLTKMMVELAKGGSAAMDLDIEG